MTTQPLGVRIRRARERARLSQEDLAKAVGASVRAVGDWENGRRKPRNRLGALEDVLGVSLSDDTAETSPAPSVIDEKLGEKADDFRDAMRALYGPDADRQIRLVEEALSQPPAEGAAASAGCIRDVQCPV